MGEIEYEIRRIVGETGVRIVTTKSTTLGAVDKHDIHVLTDPKDIVKITRQGPPGPKGDTSTFNDLEIDDLAARFLARLV